MGSGSEPFFLSLDPAPEPASLVHDEYQYLKSIQNILTQGARGGDQTGVDTIGLFGLQMRFSLRDNTFPLLTTKSLFYQGIVEELLWFIRGSTNAKELQDRNVHFWDANSSREYLDSIGLSHRRIVDLGPVYGFQWRHYGAKYVDMDTDYTREGVDQLSAMIDTIRNRPDDQRILMCSWNPTDLPAMALPPCHCLVQFYVADGELSSQLYQWSGDMGLGVPFNIASYCLLTFMLAHITGLRAGEFVHTIGEAHVYQTHVEALQSQLQRTPRPFPTIYLNPHVNDISDFTIDDFDVRGYNPHEKIQLAMAA